MEIILAAEPSLILDKKTPADKGFTLIEFVAVIVLLGVLAVSVLPKFVDLRQDAHDNVAQQIVSAFGAGVKQFNYSWQAKGGDVSTINGTAINSNGWPGPAPSTTPSDTACVDIWNAALNRSDSIATDDTQAWCADGRLVAGTGQCRYTYIKDQTIYRHGDYNLQTGEVTYTQGSTSPACIGGGGSSGFLSIIVLLLAWLNKPPRRQKNSQQRD